MSIFDRWFGKRASKPASQAQGGFPNFLRRHPPASTVWRPAPAALAPYDGVVPATLMALWTQHGAGAYGELPITIVDPSAYQRVLDAAIVDTGDALVRVPIGYLPFGELLYWRKLPDGAEDVCLLDVERRATDVLAWRADEFFEQLLGDPRWVDQMLVDRSLLDHARSTAGALADGQCWWIDRTLDALGVVTAHKRDHLAHVAAIVEGFADDAEARTYAGTVAQALPAVHRSAFVAANMTATSSHPHAGLYVANQYCWHKALALNHDGRYVLLFWDSDKPPQSRPPRLYEGTYVARDGEILFHMDERDDTLGSDFAFERLVVGERTSPRMLFVHNALDSVAEGIHWKSCLTRCDELLLATSLDAPMQEFPSDGLDAPPWNDLPAALQALVLRRPCMATITRVDRLAPTADDADADEHLVTIVCDDPAMTYAINRPWCSPDGVGKSLLGWLSEERDDGWQLRVRAQRDDDRRLVDAPAVGDALVSRVPGLAAL